MQTLGIKAVCLVLLIHVCSCVIVKDGDFTFTLDSVKELKKVLDMQVSTGMRSGEVHQKKVCTIPELPKEFALVCASPNAEEVFDRLARIAVNPDVCEVCAFAACSGC